MKGFYKNKKAIALILGLLLLLGTVFAEDTNSLIEKGQNTGPGISYKNGLLITPDGRFVINTLEATPGTDFLRIETGDSGNKITSMGVSKQALLKAAQNRNIIGAINGDFFDMKTIKGLTYGTSIMDGEIKTTASSNTIFGITEDNRCFIGDLTTDGMIYLGDGAFPLDKVNRLRWTNQAILYTPAFGDTTKTNTNGLEIVIKGMQMPIKGNTRYTGRIEAIYPSGGNTPIPADGIVISAEGTAAQSLANAIVGQEISFMVNLSRMDLRYAVSGFPRLIENGVRTDEIIAQREDAAKRHPRTAVGIKAGKVVMVTVDGRQPNVSDGMTLYELADYLLSMGVENAVNLDGGGSTTMVARKQGQAQAEIVNVPSDGSERSVGNSILFISEAPLSDPAYVVFNQENVQVYKGSTFKPTFFAMDQYYNLITKMEKIMIKYAADGKTGTMSKAGVYKAGKKAAASYMDVFVGKAKGRLPIAVVDEVGSLNIDNEYLHLNPGEKIQLNLKAYDALGKEIVITPSAVVWNIAGSIGTVDSKGIFTAGKKKGDGKLTVKINKTIAVLNAKIGKSPIVAVNFDKLDNIEVQSIKSKTAAILAVKGEPIKGSKSALKLVYDFTEAEAGTAVAYANFKQPVNIIGKPTEIGLWVYGDGSNHWLRGNYTNAKGIQQVMDFTAEGKLNWKGWKFVYAVLPKDEAYPIKIDKVYLAETLEERKDKGKIFIDELTSIYNLEKDFYSPELAAAYPAQNEILQQPPTQLTFDVTDKGTGINTKSIKLSVNGKLVTVKFDAKTGRISYKPSKVLAKGDYKIKLQLKDKAGNALIPEYLSTFSIQPPVPQ